MRTTHRKFTGLTFVGRTPVSFLRVYLTENIPQSKRVILPEIFKCCFCLRVHLSQLSNAVFVRVDEKRVVNFICVFDDQPNTRVFVIIQVRAVRIQHLTIQCKVAFRYFIQSLSCCKIIQKQREKEVNGILEKNNL